MKHFSLTIYTFDEFGECSGTLQRILDCEKDISPQELQRRVKYFTEDFEDVVIPGTSDL